MSHLETWFRQDPRLGACAAGCDQEVEVRRLLALGARRIDVGQGDAPWIVFADPEGNEFCLLRSRVG